jgi:hypothetical protein
MSAICKGVGHTGEGEGGSRGDGGGGRDAVGVRGGGGPGDGGGGAMGGGASKQAPTGYRMLAGMYTFPTPQQLRYPKSELLSAPGKGLPSLGCTDVISLSLSPYHGPYTFNPPDRKYLAT